jgi:hypothetical protein
MAIKYPPNTLQIFAQIFTGSWSTEKLLMFSCCLSSTVFVSLYRFEYFHKDRGQQNTNQLYKSFELQISNLRMTCHGTNGELSYAMSC